MGSLNGDATVMRNGRSTSQISIYNYPEHLNPFYEGDQHKRLRFWKINKNALNEGRRNSFSISNLKDMWAFKSFRLKKKSSTLGINKTSESPPPLRRELQLANGWDTFDHRLRPSSNSPSMWNENFERNTICRTSLQNMPTKANGFGLNRNDNYRSTIQYGGSMRSNYLTPQSAKQQTPKCLPSMQLRSSHGSLVSTNPFDSDNENNDLNVSEMQTSSATSTLSKRNPRKKKRAPAPPTPVLQTSTAKLTTTSLRTPNDSSQNDTKEELCIREDGDIANLTAQIEHFVDNINKENFNKNNPDVPPNVIETNTTVLSPQPTPSKHTDNSNSQSNQNLNQTTVDQAVKDANVDARVLQSSNSQSSQNPNQTAVDQAVKDTNIDARVLQSSKISQNYENLTQATAGQVLEDADVSKSSSSQNNQKLNQATAGRALKEANDDVSVSKSCNGTAITITTTDKSKTEVKLQQQQRESSTKATASAKPANDHPKHVELNRKQTESKPRSNLQQAEQPEFLQTALPNKPMNIQRNVEPENLSKSKILSREELAQPKSKTIPNDSKHIAVRMQPHGEKSAALASNVKHPNATNGIVKEITVKQNAATGTEAVSNNCEPFRIQEKLVSTPPPIPAALRSKSRKTPTLERKKCLPEEQPQTSPINGLQSRRVDSVEKITAKTSFVLVNPPRNNNRISLENLSPKEENRKCIQNGRPLRQTSNELVITEEYLPASPKVEKPLRVNKTNIITVPRPPPRVVKTDNSTASNRQQLKHEQHEKLETKSSLNIKEPLKPTKPLEEIKIPNISNHHLNCASNATVSSRIPSEIGNRRNENEGEADTEVQLRNNYAGQHLEWKQSTLAPLERNIPPEKRKSVKDIIESINRSQRLLHTTSNKQFQMSPQLGDHPRRSANRADTVEDPLYETQKEIKRLVEEIDILSNKHSISSPMLRTNSTNNLDKPHNDEIFQKCKVNKEVCNYRESSPISSNLDWNPLPKPKRTKTFD